VRRVFLTAKIAGGIAPRQWVERDQPGAGSPRTARFIEADVSGSADAQYLKIDPARGSDQAMYSDGCLAASGEQFYVNIRWTFNNCPFGARACAFTVQWGEGAF